LDEKSEDALSIYITVDINNIGQLGRLFAKVESVQGVISVTRASETRREG